MEKIYIIIVYISLLSTLLPFIALLIKPKAQNEILWALLIYSIGSIVFEGISLLFTLKKIFILIFTVFEFGVTLFIYYKALNIKKIKIPIIILFAIYNLVAFMLYFKESDFMVVDSFTVSIQAIITICLCVSYFLKEFIELKIPKLTQHYLFWINSAYLIYFGTGLLLFIFRTYIRDNVNTIGYFLMAIHLFANISFHILLTIGVCKTVKT